MAEKALDLQFFKSINNNTAHPARRWLGGDYSGDLKYGICVTAELPRGVINSLTVQVQVVDRYSGHEGYWSNNYAIKISTSEIPKYDQGEIPDNEIDGYLKLEKIWSPNGAATAQGVISSDKLVGYGGQKVYIYLGTLESDNNNTIVSLYPEADDLTKNVWVTVNYTEYTAVTSPTITSSSSVKRLTDSLTINWSGAKDGVNVNITGYILNIKKNSELGTILYTKTGISPSSNSLTIKISDLTTAPARGDKIYATIQAIGSVSGYSGEEKSNQVCIINSLPSAPTILSYGAVIDASHSSTFSLAEGTDKDNQTLKIKYKIGANGTLKELSGISLTLTINDGLAAGSNTIYFYTYDGLENSVPVSANFTVNYAPEISDMSISYTKVENFSGNKVLATQAKIVYQLVRPVSNPQFSFKIRTAASASSVTSAQEKEVSLSGYYILNTSTRTLTFDITKIPSSIIPYGNFFQIAVKISDSIGSSSWSNFLEVGQKPAMIANVGYDSLVNDAVKDGSVLAKTNYFKNQVKVTLTNPSGNVNTPKIKTVTIYATHKNGEILTNADTTEGRTHETVVNLSAVTENETVTFKVQIKDVADQVSILNISTQMIKASSLVFVNSNLSLSHTTLKPFSNTAPLTIIHSFANSSGTLSENIQYQYKVKIDSTSRDILSFQKTDSGQQRQIVVSKDNINQTLKGMVNNLNSSYLATVAVTAVDGFGTTRTVFSTLTVNFIEAPTFPSGAQFKIKHDYDTGNSTVTSTTGLEVNPSNSNYSTNLMFNSEEGIIFVIPKATDSNNDIEEYQIFLSRMEVVDAATPNYSNFTFSEKEWLSLSRSQLESGAQDTNYYYYRYKASQYSKNEFFYFKIRVRDSKLNYSEEKTSVTHIMGCRTMNPTFTVDDLTASLVNGKLTINYNFAITDLGGSAKSSGWDQSFYDKYKNFERNLPSGYSPKLELKVEVSSEQTFAGAQVITQNNQNNSYLNFDSTGITINSFSGDFTKIYVRFTLKVAYGVNSTSSDGYAFVASAPQILTFFGSVPTVAHRKHHVGINTATFSEEDVFVIENFAERKKVVLKGYNEKLGTSYVIHFNLVEGMVSGTMIDSSGAESPYLKIENATISGGSW